jgi:hypothetical protein
LYRKFIGCTYRFGYSWFIKLTYNLDIKVVVSLAPLIFLPLMLFGGFFANRKNFARYQLKIYLLAGLVGLNMYHLLNIGKEIIIN